MRASVLRTVTGAILLCVMMVSPQTNADELTDQFESIKEFLVETVSESQRVGAATTYALLRDNLASFRQLKHRVDQAPHVDYVIDDLAKELDSIAGNFERAARLRNDYAIQTGDSQQQLADKRRITRDNIAVLEQKIATRQTELDHARNGLTDPDQRAIVISANTTIINSLQAQIAIWHQFEQTQQRLASSLEVSTKKVDFLLFVLEKNAQVYREAANVAKLRQSVRLALNNLQSLGAMEGALADLAASWREVDQIVGEIGRAELGYSGSS